MTLCIMTQHNFPPLIRPNIISEVVDTCINDHVMFQVQVDSSKTEYTFTGLQEFMMYTFRVVANNTNGAGVSSPEVSARTFSDAPSDVPQNFTLETASSTVS